MNARTLPIRRLDGISLHSRACSIVLAAALTLVACGAEFGRDDAIAALQTTGVTDVEATCMADSLAVLGQLDAADPRESRTEERREAFVAASTRCIRTEVLPVVVERSVVAEVNAGALGDPENTPYVVIAEPGNAGNDAGQPDVLEDLLEDVIAGAVAELQRQGRSEVNATCIVEVLTGAQATHLFAEPNFGLGLDPFEANAMAACLSNQ